MAVVIDNTSVLKGRSTIRKNDSANRGDRPNRQIGLWAFDAKPNTTLAKLERSYLAALNAVDNLGIHKAEAAKSGKFTPEGVNDQAFKFAKAELIPTLKKSRDAVAAARKEAAALREKVRLQPTDKTDVVGFMRRQEMRNWLAAMPSDKRNALMARNPANIDPDLALAVMEMPAAMTGVLEADRNRVLERALEAQHGPAIVDLWQLEQAIEVASTTLEAARDEIRLEVGIFDPHKFNEEVAPIEHKAGAPYLKQDGDQVRVLVWDAVLKRGSWEPADEEQIKTGVFYKSADEYAAANPDLGKAA